MKTLFLFCSVLLFATEVMAVEFLSDLDVEAFAKIAPAEASEGSANPFAAKAANLQTLTLEDLQLMGVAVNDEEQYALISGYLVRPGEKIAGYRVDMIEPGRVVLKRLDEIFVLTMSGGMK